MAVVDKGIIVEIPEALVPDGFVPPAYVEVSDYEYKREYQLNVLKSAVENAATEVTFDNIITEAAIGILKQIFDIITTDFIGTNTVDYHTVWKEISSNSQRSKANDFYTDTPFSYICKVEVYIKTT